MRTNELVREVKRAARGKGLDFTLVRRGAEHEVWRCGEVQTYIPRHREVGPKLAFEIRRQLEPALGKDWWR